MVEREIGESKSSHLARNELNLHHSGLAETWNDGIDQLSARRNSELGEHLAGSLGPEG
jgi:hypothetical protein